MNAQTKYKLEPLEIVGPNSIGAYTIMHAQHGTHRATTYDPSFARLIAAAPDLLDALQAYMSDYRSEGCDLPNCGLCARSKAAEEKARAAIAKAVTP